MPSGGHQVAGVFTMMSQLEKVDKARQDEDEDDGPSLKGVMQGAFGCLGCCLCCCYLPPLIVLSVLVSENVGIELEGALVLLGVACSGIACAYFSHVRPVAHPDATCIHAPCAVFLPRAHTPPRSPPCPADAQPQAARAQPVPHLHLEARAGAPDRRQRKPVQGTR